MSEFKELEQGLINLRDQCWNLEQKIQYLCECLGGLETALERWGEKPRDYDGSAGCCYYPLKPAPATVERFTVYKCYAYNRQEPIGEVVAERHGPTPTQCIEVVHNGKSEIFSPKQYEWLVDYLTSAGIWERKDV